MYIKHTYLLVATKKKTVNKQLITINSTIQCMRDLQDTYSQLFGWICSQLSPHSKININHAVVITLKL